MNLAAPPDSLPSKIVSRRSSGKSAARPNRQVLSWKSSGSAVGGSMRPCYWRIFAANIRRSPEPPGFAIDKLGAGRWRVNGPRLLAEFRRECPPLGDVPDVDTMGGL